MTALRAAPATIAPRGAVPPDVAGFIAVLRARITRVVGHRVARLRTGLLVFVLLIPATLTALFGQRG